MKRWMKVLIGVVVVVAVLLAALTLFLGQIVKTAVNTAGPKMLGVPISVKSVSVSLFSGRFGLNDLVIGNPEGYKTPDAIRLKEVVVNVKMGSLFTKVIVIDRIYVDRTKVTYELRLNGSNIGAIQASLASPKPAAQPSPDARKVVINDCLIEHGSIDVSTIGMAGKTVSIPLPTIHLTDIGKQSGGASFAEVLAKVFDAIAGAVTQVVAGLGKGVSAVGEGAVNAGKAVGEGAVSAGKAVGDGASKAMKSVGDLFKK